MASASRSSVTIVPRTRRKAARRGRLRTMLEALPDLIIDVDADGRIGYVNRSDGAAFHSRGTPKPGCLIYDVLPTSLVPNVQRRLCLEPEPTRAITFEYAVEDAGDFYEARLLPIQAHHTLVIIRNITERKQAETRLSETHRQQTQLLSSISSIIIGVDGEDRVTLWNEAAARTLAISSEEAVGQPFLELAIPWDWPEILYQVSNCREENSGTTTLKEVRYTRPDGKQGFLGITFDPIQDPNRDYAGFLLLANDLTEKKTLEAQLAQAQKLESIGQLAAGIAHEINTPIQYIGDNTRFLSDAFADLARAIRAYQRLAEAVRSEKRSPAAIQAVNEISRKIDLAYLLEEIPTAIQQSLEGIEHVAGIVLAMKKFSYRGTEEKTCVDINEALKSTVTVARNEWKYVAEVQLDLDPDLPQVPCLPGELNQIFLNIVVNAAHAIEAVVGKGTGRKGTIGIRTRRRDRFVEIAISDTGCGIPPEIRSRIFDPFFTTKEVGKGTGQGLAISHNVVVEKHHGTLTFESEPGKGTTFYIRLPVE